MSPIRYCTVTVSNADLADHVSVSRESLASPERIGAINGQQGTLPNMCHRTLLEQLPAIVYVDVLEESNPALYMSSQSEEITGYAPEEWLADLELWMKLLHPEDRERVFGEASYARRTGGTLGSEYRIISKDGRTVWIRDEAVQVESGEDSGRWVWQGVMLDVTERRQIQEERERQAQLLYLTQDNVIIRDAENRISFWNQSAEQTYGWSAWESLGNDSHALLKTQFPEPLEEIERKLIKNGYWQGRLEHCTRDGQSIVVSSRWALQYAKSSEPAAVLEINTDITDQERQQEELRENKKLLETTFESAGVGMAHVTPDGHWVRVNDKLCEISGYSREELLSATFLDLTPLEDRQDSFERVHRMLTGGLGPYSMERRYVRKDGLRIWVNLSVSLVRKHSNEPDFFVCIAEDITERKIAELVPDLLTGREMQVLHQIVEGKTNPQIAEDLRYSVGIVKLCVQRIIVKLGVENRKQAASRAIDIGLVSPLH